jgi:hypothetical protein
MKTRRRSRTLLDELRTSMLKESSPACALIGE